MEHLSAERRNWFVEICQASGNLIAECRRLACRQVVIINNNDNFYSLDFISLLGAALERVAMQIYMKMNLVIQLNISSNIVVVAVAVVDFESLREKWPMIGHRRRKLLRNSIQHLELFN